MQADEIKILTHLLHRKGKADSQEIEGAWKFDDFDTAISSLIEKGFVEKMEYAVKKDSYSCKLTMKGREALKEV